MARPDTSVDAQIEAYVASQPERKCDDMRALHRLIRGLSPQCETWFLDGRDGDGKIVSNPNIGYGRQTIEYASGKTRQFYRIGLSANTAGLSLYVIGIEDKAFLSETWGKRLGKANVTGYCIKFRALKDVDLAVLEEVIRFGLEGRHEGDGS